MRRVWQKRMSQWLDKRIPRAREYKLDLKSIFIFPSRFGWLYLTLCIGIFLLGTNYQNNLMLLMCYFLIALFLVSLFASYINFSRIHVQVGKLQPIFAGDTLPVPIWFDPDQHAASTPHGIATMHFWQDDAQVNVDFDDLHNPTQLSLLCHQRGKSRLPRITLNSQFPLGLYRCWTHLSFDPIVTVYPRPVPCATELFERDTDEQEGDGTVSQRGYDDFDSLSPYRTGEPLNHIAWKQLAKGQGLVSKQFSSSAHQRGWLRLPPVSAEELETELGKLCYQVLELSRAGHTFGLELVSHTIAPGSGAAHQKACLDALASFNGSKE